MSLQEACNALAIDVTTLYRWLARAHIQADHDAVDKRRRVLTLAQVQELARIYDRQLQGKQVTEALQESMVLASLVRIEQKLDDLAASVATMTAQPERQQQKVQSELPDELMAWRDYAREKGYAETTIKRAIERGDVPVYRGKWKRGKGIIKEAIDDEGKRAMRRLYQSEELPTN